jgi:hypothetical protein
VHRVLRVGIREQYAHAPLRLQCTGIFCSCDLLNLCEVFVWQVAHLCVQLGLQVLEQRAARVHCRGPLFCIAIGYQQGHDCCWQIQTPAIGAITLHEQLQSTYLLA